MNKITSPSLPDADIGEWLTSDPSTFAEKAKAIWQAAVGADDDHPYRTKYGLGEGLIWVYDKSGFVNGEELQNAVVVPYFKGSTNEITAIRFIVVNEAGLRRVLASYVTYYMRSRTHLGLAKDCLIHRLGQSRSSGRIVAMPEVGGLHHRYDQAA